MSDVLQDKRIYDYGRRKTGKIGFQNGCTGSDGYVVYDDL